MTQTMAAGAPMTSTRPRVGPWRQEVVVQSPQHQLHVGLLRAPGRPDFDDLGTACQGALHRPPSLEDSVVGRAVRLQLPARV